MLTHWVRAIDCALIADESNKRAETTYYVRPVRIKDRSQRTTSRREYVYV